MIALISELKSPPALTIPEFCAEMNISRSSWYALVRGGMAPPTIRLGSSVRIGRKAAEDWRAFMERRSERPTAEGCAAALATHRNLAAGVTRDLALAAMLRIAIRDRWGVEGLMAAGEALDAFSAAAGDLFVALDGYVAAAAAGDPLPVTKLEILRLSEAYEAGNAELQKAVLKLPGAREQMKERGFGVALL